MACKDDPTLEECSICMETFDDPRKLPCTHAFCLKCLEKTQPKTKIKCALCRKQFAIPVGGLSGLPKRTMIPNRIELSKEPKSSENHETGKEKQTTIEKTVKPDESSENIRNAAAQLPADALHCGNCNNCEHCNRAQDARSNEEVQKGVALDGQILEKSTEAAEIPDSEDPESLCDICVLNNSDGKQKESTATLYCMDCNENQCEKCSAEHMRQRLCKHHTVVSLEDHLKEKLKQKEEPETTIFCDVCIANNETGTSLVAIAMLHCIDCTENQCEDCSREHKRQRLCKEHQIVELDDQLKGEFIKMKTMAKSTDDDILCDVCAENSDSGNIKISATWHCTNCNENQCEDCSREHKRQRLCKDHQLVELDDQLKGEFIKKKAMAKSTDDILLCDVCADSSDCENIKISATWHCTDCNENQCDSCNREHKRQRSLKSHQCEVLNDQLKEKLLKAKLMATSTEIKVFCEVCKEDNEVGKKDIAATHYCTECNENQCEDCSREHKRQKLFKKHQLITIDDKMKEAPLNVKELDKKPDLEIICDICSENSDHRETWSAATLHCLECDENHCKICSKEHKKQSVFRSHEIVPIDQKSSVSALKAVVDTLCDMCTGYCTDQTATILKATLYCIDCQENQCEECNRSHLRQKLFREHQVIALNAQLQQQENHPRTCSVHIKDKLKFYCFTCQQVICMKCVDKEHNSHEYQFACTVTDGFRNEIEGYLENVDSWLQQGETTKHALQAKYLKTEQVRNVSRKSELSYASEVSHSSNEHQLYTGVELIKELDEHLAKLSAFKRTCCGLKAQKSYLSICLVMNELRSKFEESRRQQELFSPERLLPRHATSFADCKSSDPKSPYYGVRQQMKKIAEEELTSMLTDESYSKIRKIIERPHIKEDDKHQLWRIAFPYIIQRMRMWNGYVLTAPNIADLIVQTQNQKAVVSESNSASSTKTIQKIKTNDMSIYPVSRLDCLTYLINIADCIVAHDILRIMSKFPMAIPLIIQDIREDDKYIVTVPIIQNTVIKWESTPGQIVENHLFTNPFRMVAAIRLGTNKIGKSTILNQLMSTPFLFSSRGEAGSRYGRPSTIDGAVEIVWLTQETCSSSSWKMMREYYRGNTEEVAILANLHGDALQHQETLKYLEKHVCSFIVFLMPDFTEKELNELKQCIKTKHIIQVLVDPQGNVDEESYMNTIRTDSLSSDDTLQTLRLLLRENLDFSNRPKAESGSIEEACQQYESIKYTKALHCKKSAEVVEIVRNHGCLNIKQLLISADIKSHATWNYNLKRLIKLSLEIISLQTRDAKKYLTYVETNLSQISANESMTARSEVSDANKGLRRIVPATPKATNGGNSEDKKIEADFKKAQQRLKAAMDKVDNTNLGQEHFFRTLGQLYENSFEVADLGELAAVRDLPNHFADLLINGHAIEMLDGDSGKIQLIWIKAICDSVLKKLPTLKVFVISIIGLQSSGKSTLLNALFSCRFAVSVGRCSRGLFMRMIFLDNTLRRSHGFDAIILIDTEGLSSPEKMNDPKANQKDRLMATYAMGISNLTIVNILGEGMTEMTEILQIAIVAMARLRGGGIKPDILMIQHLQERNVSKIDQAKGQFCEAINKAFELINKNDVEIGLASAECLAELTDRIHSGDLFQHFGPFKDGSSVNSPPSESYHEDIVSLLETILKRTAVSENKTSFERWCNHFESYWTCVQEENFALNFKNVKHIADFLYFEKKISKVRELLDRSIRSHREKFSIKIRVQVGSQVAEKKNTRTDSMHRKKLLEDIKQQLQLIPQSCPGNCGACRQFSDNHVALLEELSSSEWIEDTKRFFEKQKTRLHEITMSMLGQTFDGSLVKQGCFSEFSVIIATELNDALRKRPSGIYEPEERRNITKTIWEHLQQHAAGMEGKTDLDEKINQALHREYSGVLSNIVKDFKIDMTREHLANSRAIKSLWSMLRHLNYKLSEDQMNSLINTIDQLIESVFGKRCVNFSKTGLDFEEQMVGDIKAAFPDAIKKFEGRFCMNLDGTFKMNLQIYALQHFRRTMMDLQKIWDSQNKPSEILKQKKQDYITEIETRLKSGFSSAGEGEIVATKLYNTIKKKAIQAGYDEKVQSIKDMSWTTNSEKVRLCYFEELAKEVAEGKKERALRHFQNPKGEVQKWYKERVDSFDANDRVMKIYDSTLKMELKRLLQKISTSTTPAEINRIVAENIKVGDDQYYSKLDPKHYDFEKLKESIERKLQSFYEVNDREIVVFPLSSYDSEIMGRLGCTEHCFWCGALCWGSRGHQLEKDKCPELETHHSCHQPSGLIGVRGRTSRILRSRACHNWSDDTRVYFQNCEEDKGMLWSEAKRNHFSDWKFDVHCIMKFDELMRWFFQELHHDIAKGRCALPAKEEDLKENKCKNLKLREILKVVQNKI